MASHTTKFLLCRFKDINNFEAKGFDPLKKGKDSLFVVRQNSKFVAYENSCPHLGFQGTTMAWRNNAYLNAQRDKIICSGHGAQFDIQTGNCVHGPCKGQNLTKAMVELSDDGWLYWKKI